MVFHGHRAPQQAELYTGLHPKARAPTHLQLSQLLLHRRCLRLRRLKLAPQATFPQRAVAAGCLRRRQGVLVAPFECRVLSLHLRIAVEGRSEASNAVRWIRLKPVAVCDNGPASAF